MTTTIRHNTRFIHANGKTYMVAGEIYTDQNGNLMLSYFTLKNGTPSGATHRCRLDQVKHVLPDASGKELLAMFRDLSRARRAAHRGGA